MIFEKSVFHKNTDFFIIFTSLKNYAETIFKKIRFFSKKGLTNRKKCIIIYEVLREWRNWQTRTFEGRVIPSYGFDSRLPHQQKGSTRWSSLFCSFGNRHPLCQTAWGMSWESKVPQSSRIVVVCRAFALRQLLALLTSLQKTVINCFLCAHPSPVGAGEHARATHVLFSCTISAKSSLFAPTSTCESGSHLPQSLEELAHQGLA